jgi:predicted ester cyclase
MTDFAAAADRLVAAYNGKDWDALERLVAPDLDFAHYNRDFAFDDRDGLLAVIKMFADELAPDRRFTEPERVTVQGNVVVRESNYQATAAVDIPGFAAEGERVDLRLCTVLRFDDDGILVEWKDHG